MTDDESKISRLVHLLIIALGFIICLVGSNIFRATNQTLADLSLSLGSTLIATSVLSFLYRYLGVKNLADQLKEIQRDMTNQMIEIQNNSVLLKKFLENGVVDFWIERRQIENNM